MLGQEVGEVESGGIVFMECTEALCPGEELVTVGAGDPLDAVPLQHPIELASSPTIAVGDEYLVEVVPVGLDALLDGRGNRSRGVVISGREARYLDPVQLIDADYVHEFTG